MLRVAQTFKGGCHEYRSSGSFQGPPSPQPDPACPGRLQFWLAVWRISVANAHHRVRLTVARDDPVTEYHNAPACPIANSDIEPDRNHVHDYLDRGVGPSGVPVALAQR